MDDATTAVPVEVPTDQHSPQAPHLHYACPHCGGALDLAAFATADAHPHKEDAAPSLPSGRWPPFNSVSRLTAGLLDHWFPMTRALSQYQDTASVSLPRSTRAFPRWVRHALVLLSAILVLLWLVWQWLGSDTLPGILSTTDTALPVHGPMATAAASGAPSALTRDQAAVLAIVAHYNAADQQVAATLSLDRIRPLLDPAGPLLQRRTQQLAARQVDGAIHATRLLRWAIGSITIDESGTTATLVTQETWENQESHAMASQTATARMIYTLRRATTHSPWRIYEATRTIL